MHLIDIYEKHIYIYTYIDICVTATVNKCCYVRVSRERKLMYCRLKDLSNCRIDVKLERIECWLKMFRIENLYVVNAA